jgi:glycosyltransferase involved in cell wall biosynthesis
MMMSSAFMELDHEVILFGRKSKTYVSDVFKYYGVSRKFPIILTHWPNIRGVGGFIHGHLTKHKITKLQRDQILYGRDLYSLFMLRNLGFPIIYESHKPPTNRLHRWLETRLIRSDNFQKLVLISNSLKAMYLKMFDWLRSECVHVAHDAATDYPYDTLKTVSLPGNSNSIKAGYAGSLLKGRGITLIINIAKKCPEVDFHILGGSNSEISIFKSKCNTSNLFFHEFISPGSIAYYYNSFDILLAPYQDRVTLKGNKGDTSKWMSPIKIFEYMASGKAIIASDLPVLREILIPNINCFLCHPRDSSSWVNAIKILSTDKNLRNKLGLQARNQFQAKHTWYQRAQSILHEYTNDLNPNHHYG